MLCALILYVSGGTYSLTSTLNDNFFSFEELFDGKFYLPSEFLPVVDEEIFFFLFCFDV